MANEEIKYFNVKNISVRLVHIGGQMVVPETVVAIIDDEHGINRADVEDSEYLEVTDEEASESPVETKPVAKKGSEKTAAAKTPTGAGWSAKS